MKILTLAVIGAGCVALFTLLAFLDREFHLSISTVEGHNEDAPQQAISKRPVTAHVVRSGNSLAQVLVYEDLPPFYSVQGAVKLSVTDGIVSHDGKIIPTDKITEYVNDFVSRKGVDSVLMTAGEKSTIKDIIPVIDASRKSNVETVIINALSVEKVDRLRGSMF